MIITAAVLAVDAAALTLVILGFLGRVEEFWGPALLAAGCVVVAVADLVSGAWPWAAFQVFLAAVNAWIAWRSWRRRKRRRAPRTLGAKARARIAAMTARMRERPARPVLRPVPGGAT